MIPLFSVPSPRPNNYLKVHGSPEVFTFNDGHADSVESALSAARSLAYRLRTPRGPLAVVLWRKCAAPQLRSLPLVGEVE